MVSQQQSNSDLAVTPCGTRRLVAVFVDAAIAILVGFAAGAAAGIGALNDIPHIYLSSPTVWGAAFGGGIALSLCNQVLLTWAAHASLGKAVAGLRVVRTSDGGRPGFIRLCRRWLFGFYWMIVFVPIHVAADSNVEQQDAVGLRVVRRGRGMTIG
ncbi:RDD family protein [Streptomyces sp. NPDC002309]